VRKKSTLWGGVGNTSSRGSAFNAAACSNLWSDIDPQGPFRWTILCGAKTPVACPLNDRFAPIA
jgi:hypothetical protein